MNKITLTRAIVQDLYAHAQNDTEQAIQGSIKQFNGQFTLSSIDEPRPYACYYSELDSNNPPAADDERFEKPETGLLMVISLQTKGVLELTAYQKSDGTVEKIDLSII